MVNACQRVMVLAREAEVNQRLLNQTYGLALFADVNRRAIFRSTLQTLIGLEARGPEWHGLFQGCWTGETTCCDRRKNWECRTSALRASTTQGLVNRPRSCRGPTSSSFGTHTQRSKDRL